MDIEFLLWLQSIREASSPVVKGFFTFLGSDAASIVMMLVPCLVYWCLDKKAGELALFAYGTSAVFNMFLKNTVACYRPWIRDVRIIPDAVAKEGATGYSFPSTHTQSAASALVALGWYHRDRRWPVVVCLLAALLVGFSRNFLGVHTPQDVLVGYVEGCIFVLVASRLIEWVDEDPERDVRVVLASLAAVAVFLVYVTVKPYPMEYVDGELLVDPFEMIVDCYKVAGGFAGMALGWFAERRLVRFETGEIGLKEVVARMLLGAAIAVTAYVPVGHALVSLLGSYAGQFVRHLVTFILAVVVIPALFAPLGRALGGKQS